MAEETVRSQICYTDFARTGKRLRPGCRVGEEEGFMSKGDRTRARIIEQSAPIFNKQGSAGTALSDLMDATGLRKGGLYRHFAGKEKLAAAAFDYAWQQA